MREGEGVLTYSEETDTCTNTYLAKVQEVDNTEAEPFIVSETLTMELTEDVGRDACCIKFASLVDLGPIAIEGQEDLLGGCRLEVDDSEAEFFANG